LVNYYNLIIESNYLHYKYYLFERNLRIYIHILSEYKKLPLLELQINENFSLHNFNKIYYEIFPYKEVLSDFEPTVPE
jgi:hypothetical protein